MTATLSLDLWTARHDNEQVDLAFVIDCTGSMGSYIAQAQRNISSIAETISRTAFNVRLALVEYRDHPPQESTYIARSHDFTSSVNEMKGWVNGMSASGGGDLPEAVADGLSAALDLTYRERATKICVLIADAPPHGLGHTSLTDEIPEGCPADNDPIVICHEMARRGIILYCVGCEPPLAVYKDFFMGMSHITGGQYVSLLRANSLSTVIINSTREEVGNEQLMGHVEDYLYMVFRENGNVTVRELTNRLHLVLRLNNNRTARVQLGGNDLEPVSALGRRISYCRSLQEVRELMQGNYAGQAREMSQGETFDMTDLDVVTARTCERLVRRGLGRTGRVPSEHSDTEMEEPNSN